MKTHISNLLLSTFLFSSLWQNPVWPFGWTPLHMRRPVANLLLCPLQLLTLPRLPMTPLSHPHRHLHLPTEKQVRSNLSASFNPISWVSLWDIADRMYTLGRLHINMCPFIYFLAYCLHEIPVLPGWFIEMSSLSVFMLLLCQTTTSVHSEVN